MLIRDGRLEEGETILNQRLEIQKRILNENDPDLADTLNQLGYLAYLRSQHEQSEKLHRRALEIFQLSASNDQGSIAETLDLLATTLHGQKKYDEAQILLEECMQRWSSMPGGEPLNVANVLLKLGVGAMKQNDFESAQKLYSQALEIEKRILQPSHPSISETLLQLCELKIRQGQLDEAKLICENALEIQRKSMDPNSTSLAKSLTHLGLIASRSDEHVSAEVYYREATAIYTTANPTSSGTAITLFLHARSVAELDRCEEAVVLLRESLHQCEKVLAPDDWRMAMIKQYLGRCLTKLQQYEEVEELLLAAHARMLDVHGAENKWVKAVVQDIIDYYTAQNKMDEARRWKTNQNE